MRSNLIGLFVVCIFALEGFAEVIPGTKAQFTPQKLRGSQQVESSRQAIGKSDTYGELDEIIGDTLIVGNTRYDQQHNSSVGRMIVHYQDGSDHFADMTWMRQQPSGATRNAYYSRVILGDDGSMVIDDTFSGGGVNLNSQSSGAGYCNIAVHREEENTSPPYPAYHGPNPGSGIEYHVWVNVESFFVPGFFSTFEILPEFGEMDFPRLDVGPDQKIHMLTQDFDTDDTYYIQLQYDPMSSELEITNPSGTYDYIDTYTEGRVSYNIVASEDGSRVVAGILVPRHQYYGDSDDYRMGDKDLVLFESDDGGETFPWGDYEQATNVTQFEGPDLSLLPDSMAANRDTLRAYLDFSMFMDEDNVLHAAIPTSQYYYLSDEGTVLSRMFYWNEEEDEFVQMVDGMFFNNANPGAFSLMADRPSLYKDPDEDLVWCIYRQFGEPGDTLETGEALDTGSMGYPNADIYVTCYAPYPPIDPYTRRWVKGINLTNTRTMESMLPAGESRNERDCSLAMNNDGDYLHIAYMLDVDGGNFQYDESSDTVNEFVYHRVSKQELQVIWENMPEEERYVDLYPMHVADDDAVEEQPRTSQSLMPGQFALKAVYPNPFNSTARIAFEMEAPGEMKLVLYDLLGREVVTLADRYMQRGTHQFSLFGEELASGIYFLALESGQAREVRKVALLR